MATKQDRDLLKTLRAGGVRKSVARLIAQSTGKRSQRTPPKMVTRSIESLQAAAGELDRRVRGSQRSEAAKKAARTRKRKAAQRSAAAKKGAKTRARRRS